MAELDKSSTLNVVVGIVSRGGSEILINQRSYPEQFAGQWEFPGGKIEANENEHQALRRELYEELGIAILDSAPLMSLSHQYEHAYIRLFVRLVSGYEGIPQGKEGQKIKWVASADLRSIDFLEANGAIVSVLEKTKLT